MHVTFHTLCRSATLALLASFSGPVRDGAAQQVDVTSVTIEEVNRALDEGTLTSERLVELSLARIEAFDQAGPTLKAVLTLNPRAR